MRTFKLVLLLMLAIALAMAVFQNTAPVQMRFFWLSAEVPAALLLFLTTVGGFILGLLVALLAKSGAKTKS